MGFMEPEIEYNRWCIGETKHHETIIVPFEYRHDVVWWDSQGYRIEDGWCARLSAPGYLDCTDWIGVYSNKNAAMAALRELYDLCELCDEDEGSCECDESSNANASNAIDPGYDVD